MIATAPNPHLAERVLRPEDAADMLGCTVRTLSDWRLDGRGPKFVRVSSRMVRYRMIDLQRWLEDRVVGSTSQQLPTALAAK